MLYRGSENKVGRMYSLEYTDVPKVFLMPHLVGYCSTNVIVEHQRAVTVSMGYCINMIRGHCCACSDLGSNCFATSLSHHFTKYGTTSLLSNSVFQQ